MPSRLKSKYDEQTITCTTSPATKSDPVAIRNWNAANKDRLASNNERMSRVDGGQVKPREYNVDRKTGEIRYVSDKGGNETDYFNIGHHEKSANQEIAGKQEEVFIQAKDQEQLECKRRRGRLYAFKIKRDKANPEKNGGVVSTAIALNEKGDALNLFLLQSLKYEKPAGEFSVIKSRDRKGADPDKLRFPNYYVVYNDELKVFAGQGITLHGGRFPDHSTGCPLVGSGYGICDSSIQGDVEIEKRAQRDGYIRLFNEKDPVTKATKLVQLNKMIDEVGAKNFKFIHYDFTHLETNVDSEISNKNNLAALLGIVDK